SRAGRPARGRHHEDAQGPGGRRRRQAHRRGAAPGLMPPRRRTRRHPLRTALVLFGLVVLALIAWEVSTWPDVRTLTRRNPPTTAFIERYRARQSADGRDERVQNRWVPYAAIDTSFRSSSYVDDAITFFS